MAMAAKMEMIAITTKSSTRVKAENRRLRERKAGRGIFACMEGVEKGVGQSLLYIFIT